MRTNLGEREKPANSSSFVKLDDGESVTIRFPNDTVVSTRTHQWVEGADGSKRNLVCPMDPGILDRPCALCDEPARFSMGKTRDNSHALVFIRGRNGKYSAEPSVLSQGPQFWDTVTMFQDKYGTLLDRDYSITRRGTGLSTTYSVIPEDKEPTSFDEETIKAAEQDLIDRLLGQSSEDYYTKHLGRL